MHNKTIALACATAAAKDIDTSSLRVTFAHAFPPNDFRGMVLTAQGNRRSPTHQAKPKKRRNMVTVGRRVRRKHRRAA